MKTKMHVAVLCGGANAEREVSIESGNAVYTALKPHCDVTLYTIPEDWSIIEKQKDQVDIVIPALHGTGGEDGTTQRHLDELGLPYIFSSIETHALALDKEATKEIIRQQGINCPESRRVVSGEEVRYKRPCVIKPNHGGSSVGVSIVRSQKELDHALLCATEEEDSVLMEDYIEGAEFTVAVAEQRGTATPLPVIQIIPKGRAFFDFASKYDPKLVEEICPAHIDEDLAARLQAVALTVHTTLNATHLTRSDMIVDAEGTIWFLECNTIPGVTLNSLTPKALRCAGIDFAEILLEWCEETLED